MMVNANLKKVVIKNFKSLHDCEIDIGKLNVVVGANASGKSNLVEAFRLLKKIYVDKDAFPFLEWWGYNNVVWQRKEELPIIIGLLFDIEGYEVYFETNFTGAGGKLQIFREVLDIRGYVKFEKEGEWITVKHNKNFIDNIIEKPHRYDIAQSDKTMLKREKNQLLKERKIRADLEQGLLGKTKIKVLYPRGEKRSKILFWWSSPPTSVENYQNEEKSERIPVLCPVIDYERFPIYNVASDVILSTIGELLILYPLNIRLMKNPQPLRKEETLKEDGSNIASLYHTIYLKEGKTPEDISNPLSIIFPNMDVRPLLTEDGRVMIKFIEDGFELLPPNTSDGLYKLLTILTAIYLKPPLLIIDEIENSLHPATLELILNTIGISENIQTIITTHSPVVVDMTELSNLILIEKKQGQSEFRRIKDTEKIKEFLIKKGITFSEGWLYGEIFKTEQKA